MEITTNPRGKFSIQIKYVLTVSISDYYYMVLRKKWESPSFSSECPICGGSNCCVRIGYYYRYVLSLEEGILILVAIARFLCRVCPKGIDQSNIARLNRDFIASHFR